MAIDRTSPNFIPQALQPRAPGGATRFQLIPPATDSVLYVMRAQDGAGTPGSNYVVWQSETQDFAGNGYAGATPTPAGAMVAGSAHVVAGPIRVTS